MTKYNLLLLLNCSSTKHKILDSLDSKVFDITDVKITSDFFHFYKKEYTIIFIDNIFLRIAKNNFFKFLKDAGFTGLVIYVSVIKGLENIEGFEEFIDDVITHPFNSLILETKIRRLIEFKMSENLAIENNKIVKFDGFILEFESRKLYFDGVTVHLTKNQINLLFYMVLNNGKELSRIDLFKKIYNIDYDPNSRAIDMLVMTLRKELTRYTGKNYINAIRCVGYVFFCDSLHIG